jgi:hypothetical protein
LGVFRDFHPPPVLTSDLPLRSSPLLSSQQHGSKSRAFSASIQAPSMAKIGSQLGGGGAATLEKVGMNLSQQVQSVAAPKLADGGGGGNMGGGVKNGGGGGDGDEGDDDDYYDEGDEEVSTREKRGYFCAPRFSRLRVAKKRNPETSPVVFF